MPTSCGSPVCKSQKIRIGADVRNGYTREQLSDAWVRYLPLLPENPEHPEHREQPEHLDIEDPSSMYADEWLTGTDS